MPTRAQFSSRHLICPRSSPGRSGSRPLPNFGTGLARPSRRRPGSHHPRRRVSPTMNHPVSRGPYPAIDPLSGGPESLPMVAVHRLLLRVREALCTLSHRRQYLHGATSLRHARDGIAARRRRSLRGSTACGPRHPSNRLSMAGRSCDAASTPLAAALVTPASIAGFFRARSGHRRTCGAEARRWIRRWRRQPNAPSLRQSQRERSIGAVVARNAFNSEIQTRAKNSDRWNPPRRATGAPAALRRSRGGDRLVEC